MKSGKRAKALSAREIDLRVISQAEERRKWEKPIKVRRNQAKILELPSDLANRAAFFTRMHRQKNVDLWLKRVIRERLELEEAAFAGIKRDLAAKNGA